MLEQQRAGAAEQTFASSLASDAKKNGLEKAAASKGLHAVTTDYVAKDGVIPGLADGSALLTQAFSVVKGADPASGGYRRWICGLPGDRRQAGSCSGVCGL